MRIVMISNDKRILAPETLTARRMIDYGAFVDRLDIIVLTQEGQQSILSDTTTAYSLGHHKIWAPWQVPRLARTIVKGGPVDLVTAQDPFWAGFTAYRTAAALNARLQLQVHTDPMSPHFIRASLANRARNMLARFLLPKANCLRVVSQRIAESIRSWVGTDVPVRTLITSYVDIDHFRNVASTIDLRERYPSFDFIILMASRLTVEKDIPTAMAAMEDVVRDFPKTLLLVVGDGPERAVLKQKAEQRGLENNIRFEGWVNELVSYYKTADLFLMTSHFEGNSRALIEAAAAGCPCVSTNVGAAPEFEGISLVPVGDHRSLAKVLCRAIVYPLSPPVLPTWVPRDYAEHLRQYECSWKECL